MILIPYSRLSRSDKTELKDVSARVFSIVSISEVLRFPKTRFFENDVECFLNSFDAEPKSKMRVPKGR